MGLNSTPHEMAALGWQFGAFSMANATCVSVLAEDGEGYGLKEFVIEYSGDCFICDLRILPSFKGKKLPGEDK